MAAFPCRTHVRYTGAVTALPLDDLAGRVRPVTLADRRILPVPEPLVPLFPDGGLRRGSTVAVDGTVRSGATSLALALVSAASQAGSWAAAVGSWCADLGLVAAAELGVCLDRFALVPEAGSHWAAVMAALLDAVDVVLVGGPARVGDARRLAARARERGAVMITLGSGWPERTDLRLGVNASHWQGIGQGCGHLRARRVEVAASGRGAATRRRRVHMWLPGEAGGVQPVEPDPVATMAPQAGRPGRAG